MAVTAPAVALTSAAAVLLVGCSTDTGAGNGAAARPVPTHSVANAASASPPATADPQGPNPTGRVGAGHTPPPPDTEGNPACPDFDSWGASGGHTGIVVAYWAHGADYVTVLVRTNEGPDVARSVDVEPGEALQLFNFPDTESAAVNEVLIITNDKRCYATRDPAMRGR